MKIFEIFLPLFIFLLSCCGGKGVNNRENSEKVGDTDKIVEFYPSDGMTVFVSRPLIYVRFGSPVTDIFFSINPAVEGYTYYIPSEFKFVFDPTEDLSMRTKYNVLVRARDVFSLENIELSFSFFTPDVELPKISQPEVSVTRCFKDSFKVYLNFQYPVSFQVYVNSYKVSEGISRGFPLEIEVQNFIKSGENEVRIIALPYSPVFEKKEYLFSITKDDEPPSQPSLQKISSTEFLVTSKDNCDTNVKYILFWRPSEEKEWKELGFVLNRFDTKFIAFDGGFICVKAVDSAGNVSDCSEEKKQGFDVKEIELDFPDCYFAGEILACQQGGEIEIFTSPIFYKSVSFLGKISGKISDVCENSPVILTEDKLIFYNRYEKDIKGISVSCEGNIVIVSDGQNIYFIENGNIVRKVNRGQMKYLVYPVVNPEAKIVDIFPTNLSFFVLISDFSPAYYIANVTGQDYQELKKVYPFTNAVLVIRKKDPTSVLYLKTYPAVATIKKISYFSGILIYLSGSGLFGDFSFFSSGADTSSNLLSGVDDFFSLDYDGDGADELFINMGKTLRLVDEK